MLVYGLWLLLEPVSKLATIVWGLELLVYEAFS